MVKITTITVMIVCLVWPMSISAKMREDTSVELKGPRGGGGVRASTVQQSINNMAEEVAKVNALESSGNIQNATYNSDGTLSSTSFIDGTRVNYSYDKDSMGNVAQVTATSQKFTVDFVSKGGGRVASVKISSIDEKGAGKPVVVLMDVSEQGPTMWDVSHNPIPYEMVSDLNKSLDGLAKTKRDALTEYKGSTSVYYDKVTKALKDNKSALSSIGIDVDMFLKEAEDKDLPDEIRRRAIDEAVGYVYAVTEKEDARRTARDFIEIEKWAKKNILNEALAIYEGKIKEALSYINKVIESLLKSKLALFMSADRERIEAIINLPQKSEVKK